MEKLFCYKRLPVWHLKSIPQSCFEKNNGQMATWVKIEITQGELYAEILNESDEVIEKHRIDAHHPAQFIEPEKSYRIAQVSNDVECQFSFYCLAENYTEKKYQMTKTHSEIISLSSIVPVGKVLDLGCGSGRNSLYLQLLGFDVDAVDKSQISIENLNKIIKKEQLEKIIATEYDINQANWQGEYNLIISTVVMMFLQPENIPNIIQNMQSITKIGGYNLIVSAMSTADYPCSVGFSFTFKENELYHYYQNWEVIEYNENIGELHKTDLNGNRIKLRFATLLAKKITE